MILGLFYRQYQEEDTGKGETDNQKLPARRMCNPPAVIPPIAKPIFVGMRIDPAEAGDQPRTAIA
jgi:hypothetical protein